MRLQISKSKNATSYYVIKSYRENGHNTSKVVEKLGTREQIMARTGCEDPEAWARAYIEELNKKEKIEQQEVLLHLKPSARIKSGEQKSFNGGYLFLQKIYHELGLHTICKEISRRHTIVYDLNTILSCLLYGRILFPSSELSVFQQSQKLLEQPSFELSDVQHTCTILAQESDFIFARLSACPNLSDTVSDIIKANHDDMETVDFLSHVICLCLKERLQNRYSCAEIIECLREMNFLRVRGTGFIPCYTRSSLTDDLHKSFGFETDHEVMTTDQMKKIYKISKK